LLKHLESVRESDFLTEEIFGAREFEKQERIYRYDVVIAGLIGLFGFL
jgi:hypothetical protein